MRVLLLDVNCGGSSTGNIVYDLFSGLKRAGHDATVCYGRGELIKERGIYKFGIDLETKIHAALARITGYNGYFSPYSTKRLIRYIDEFSPDIIHIHELHAYFVDIKKLIEHIKMKHIPVVWTFHCEYMYTGKCGYAYDCLNFENGCGNCPAVKDYPKSIFFDKTKQMLKMKKELLQDMDFTIVTPSKWLAERVKLSFLKEKDIKIIHNGVDKTVFNVQDADVIRKELGIALEDRVVLFVAPDVMSERKGGKWVLQLAETIRDQKIVFVMVGNGEPKGGARRNIIYTGAIYDKRRLALLYSLANVFLLCSEKETYSMTCAEALCCGTPVVGFKSGAPETIFKEPYARFVDYGNIDMLVEAIYMQLNIGRVPAKETEQFATETMINKYSELYQTVLENEKKKND